MARRGALRRKYPALLSCIAPDPQNFKDSPLIGTSRRPSAVLLSGTKITRFCQSRFSIRIRKSSLSSLIPVSRIKITMSLKSSRVRGRQLQAAAPVISFFSAPSSRRRCRPCSFGAFAGQRLVPRSISSPDLRQLKNQAATLTARCGFHQDFVAMWRLVRQKYSSC